MNQIMRPDGSFQIVPDDSLSDRAHPAWFDDLASSLAVRSQFVISGNTRDIYTSPAGTSDGFVTFEQVLWRILRRKHVPALLIHDPVDGLRLHSECDDRLEGYLSRQGISLGDVAGTSAELLDLHTRLSAIRKLPLALMLDYSSHLADARSDDFTRLFVGVHKTAHSPVAPRPAEASKAPPHNPVFWIVDRPADLPDWFVVRNDRLREVLAEYPRLEDRFAFAKTLLSDFEDGSHLHGRDLDKNLEQFALQCEGETLVAMRSIAQMARSEGLDLAQVSDAIAAYRTGTRRNPWKSPVLKSRMRKAKEILTERVKGQDRAVNKTLDILMRSIAGLSGAQTNGRLARPRGVLFFAGPTGVGKTELAKSVTELLFGDEAACHRFDMSEFMQESAITRLIGAPPGQPGHERGGELINAVHKRPFGVFLFDEVEKAHPRILDTFLQILDEGRLTDSRGATAFFSQALIIFTSNIGMLGGDRSTNSGMNVMPSDPHDIVENKILAAVRDHFRFELKRPELMNRIGENVVVFDFIKPANQALIFKGMVQRVLSAVADEQSIDVQFTKDALVQLEVLCTQNVFDGGRGIGNRIETFLINPLAHEVFRSDANASLLIRAVHEVHGRAKLEIEPL